MAPSSPVGDGSTFRLRFNSELLSISNRLLRDLAWTILLPSILIPQERYRSNREPVAVDRFGLPRPVIYTDSRRWTTDTDSWDIFNRCIPILRSWDGGVVSNGSEASSIPAFTISDEGSGYTTFFSRMAPYVEGRRGIYYEKLVLERFRLDPGFSVLGHDIQINDVERTIGQIDFVVQNEESAEILHVETAVKYFIQTGKIGRLDRWLGTDLSDRFDRKVLHLLHHQLPMIKNARGYPFTGRVNRSVASLKGILFYRLKERPETLGIWPRQPDGWWATPADFLSTCTGRNTTAIDGWGIASAVDWFSPVRATEFSGEFQDDPESLIRTVIGEASRRPVMVIGFSDGRERTRGFILDRKAVA